MSKKKIVELRFEDESQISLMFKDAFLVSLNRNEIYIKNKKLYMETEDTVYVVDSDKFSIVWKPSLEHIYSNDLRNLMNKSNLKVEGIKLFYEWTNPIFDELYVKLDAKDKFIEDLKNRIKSNEDYAKKIREVTVELVSMIPIEKRKDYIERFISFGMLNEIDKIPLQYYADYSPEMLSQLFEEEQMDERARVEIISQAFVVERAKQKKSEEKGKKLHNNRLINLVNLYEASGILDIYMNNILTTDELTKTKVTKKDIFELPYDRLIALLFDKNSSLPDKLKITSKDIINEYGKSVDGNKLYRLAIFGYLKPQDFIEAYEINKVLRFTDYDENKMLDENELRVFYTPSMLVNMKKEKALTPRFVEKYLEVMDFENNPKLHKEKSKSLVNGIKRDKRNNEDTVLEDDVLYFFDIGFCDLKTTEEYVSEEYIEELFMNDKLSIEDIFNYYQKGLISDDAITNYYSQEELLEFYKQGKISGKCLLVIKDSNKLMEEFIDGNITNEDFIKLYLNGNISITDFKDAFEFKTEMVDIVSFIDESVPFSKIKELFTEYLIDYSSILRLHNQGIIDDAEFEELNNALSTKEFFQELRNGHKYKVVTSREGAPVQKGKKYFKSEKEDADFSSEIALISSLLEKNVEDEQHSLIESYNVKGKPTSLNGYRIFASEELDGVVILQKSKKENAVFVMKVLQLMYFLNGKKNENGEIEIKDRMKDKAYLKTIEGVEVVEHTIHFARNLIEASSKISPQIEQKVRKSDKTYTDEVDKMIENMREEYLNNKSKER